MQDLHEKAFEPVNNNVPDFHKYTQVVINDFTRFYDLYDGIKTKHQKYISQLKNSSIVKVQHNGALEIDRTLESDLINEVKDFFIKGRILLNNWSSSKAIKDEYIDIKNILIVKDNNFEKQRDKYLALDEHKMYESLFDYFSGARVNFLTEFNDIRAEIEHSMLTFNFYQVNMQNGEISITEPLIRNKPMYQRLDFYYNSIFDFIERVMIFYYGINAVKNWKGLMNLFERQSVNYEKSEFKYVILPNHKNNDMKCLINLI
jgi:hypothetical protein